MKLPELKIGNDLLNALQVTSIEVTQELNKHWICSISCHHGVGERVPVESYLGQLVTISGVDENEAEYPLFSGFVVNVELVYQQGGSFSAQVLALSTSYKLDQRAHKQYFSEQTLAGIAGVVAGRSGMAIKVDAPQQKALDYVQYSETDFSFLSRVVDDYGAWMRPSASGAEVFAAFQPGVTVQWRDKADLLDFRISGTLAPASFSGSHYDHHVMESVTHQDIKKDPDFYSGGMSNLAEAVKSQSAAMLPSGFISDRSRVMKNDEFKETLEDEAERSVGGGTFGSGRTRNPGLLAGDEITIGGPIDAAGTYGLIKVVHTWNAGGYANSFVCTPWKKYRNPRPPAMRKWNGVVPARVTAHNDPKKMGRIQIQFFWQEDGSTHWARMISPHAGPDRGFMFMPEVGDEVAVAFEDGDPERPVIMGSLWNGVQTAPRADFRGGDITGNDVKRLMTKSGNRLQFSDKDGVETVVLATPNNNILKMTEKSDQTGRTNITIESKTGDIILHAPNGRVHIESKFYSKDVG